MAALQFVSQTGNGYFSGTWNRDLAILTLICGSMVEAAARVELVIASSNQITLPSAGVKRNQTTVTISTDTPNLPAAPGPLGSVEPVGIFSNSSILFDPTISGMPTKISLVFKSSDQLLPGDSITIFLPAFTGASSDLLYIHNITGVDGRKHPVFTNATWHRRAGQLTIYANGSGIAEADILQTVVVHAANGLRLPARGVAGNESGILITCNCAAVPLVNFVPEMVPFVSALFSGISVNKLGSQQTGHAPQADGIVLQLSGGQGSAGPGDLVALRSFASRCYESRLNQASSTRSADMVLDSNMQITLNASNLFVGTYALCYVRKNSEWVTNVGVDSETGIQIVIQNAIISAKVGLQAWGSKLEGPRNDFKLTLQSALFSAQLNSGDTVSIVLANFTCSDLAYSTASISSTLFSALSVVNLLPEGLVSVISWPDCGPVGQPSTIGGVCPSVGIYRLCFRDNNLNPPEETGISITMRPAQLSVTVNNGPMQKVDAYFPSITVALTSGGVQCCEGSKVLISLIQGGVDRSQFLYSGDSNSINTKIIISQNGAVTFTDLNIRSTGGRGFSFMMSVSNATAYATSFLLLPHHLSVTTDLTREVTYAPGSPTASLPTVDIAMMDSANQLITNIVDADNFSVAALLQTGGNGLNSASDTNFASVSNADDLLPDSARVLGRNANSGIARFSDATGLKVRRQAGTYFRIKFSLTVDPSIIVYGGPFPIAPASLKLDTLGNESIQASTVVQLGAYPYGACSSSLADSQSSCAGYSETWKEAASNIPIIGVLLLAGDGSVLSNARGNNAIYASLHSSSGAIAPCGCLTSATTPRSPPNTGCTCTSTSFDGEDHTSTLVDAGSNAAVPARLVVAGRATFGGLKVQFQAGNWFRIRFKLRGASSNVSTIPIIIAPYNLALAVHPGGAGVDWHGLPSLNSNGSNLTLNSANTANPDGIADGIGDGCTFINQPVVFLQGNGYDLNGPIAESGVSVTLGQPLSVFCQLNGTTTTTSDQTGRLKFTDLGIDCHGLSSLGMHLTIRLQFGSSISVNTASFDVFLSPYEVPYAMGLPMGVQGFRLEWFAPAVSRARPLSGFLLQILPCSLSCSLDTDLWQGGGGEVGMAQAGNGWTIWLSPVARAVDEFYTGKQITIISGAGVGQTAYIVSYTGGNRKAVIDRPMWPAVNASSKYHISTDQCTDCLSNVSQHLPFLLDSSRMDLEWTGDLQYAKSFSNNVYNTKSLAVPIESSHVTGMTTLRDNFVSETATVLRVTNVHHAGIRTGSFIGINAEIFLVTSIFMNEAVKVAREQHGSSFRATLSVGITDYQTNIFFVGGEQSIQGAGISVNALLKIGTEIVLVRTVQGSVLTVSRAQESTSAASHAAGTSVYNLHRSGAIVRVYEDQCSAGKNTAVKLCSSPIRYDSVWGTTNLTAMLSPSGSTTSLQVWDARGIVVGTFLKVNSEVMRVTDVTGNTIGVLREQKGSKYYTILPGVTGTIHMNEVQVTLSVASADEAGLNVGNYIKIDDEIMRIISIQMDVLTVARGQLGTVAAAHSVNTIVYNIYPVSTRVQVLASHAAVTFSDGALSSTFLLANCTPATNYAQTGDLSTASTLLASSMGIDGYEFSVIDAAGAGIVAGTYIKVDHEIILVSSCQGNELIGMRGVKGTVAAQHIYRAQVLVMSETINIAEASVYSFRLIPFNDNFRGQAFNVRSQSRALSAPRPLDGFAEIREDTGDCFCNLSTLLSFVSPAPTRAAPRLGFAVEMSTDPTFSSLSTKQIAVFSDRYDDDTLDVGVDASIEKDQLGPGGSARLLQRVRILTSFGGLLRDYANGSAFLYNTSLTDNFYSGMDLLATVDGVKKTATISAYRGADRAAIVMFDGIPGKVSFSVGTRLAYMGGGVPAPGHDSKFISINGNTRYYFRISAYSRAGLSSATAYSLQLLDSTPRELPAKGGQLVEIMGTGLGYQPESFSVFIGQAPCLSLGVKDKAGKRMACVSGALSGSGMDLRVEYNSGVYEASRTATAWFRSALPNIAFVYPSKVNAGDTVTIFGTGFGVNPNALVEARVGDIPCTRTTHVSDIRAECHLGGRIPRKSAVTISVNGQSSLANVACAEGMVSNTAGCVAPAEESVTIILVLGLDFSTVGDEGSAVRGKFVSSLVQELAEATGASPTMFSIGSVTAGSVVIEVVISADPTSFTSLSPANVATKLKEAVKAAAGVSGSESVSAATPAAASLFLLVRTQDLVMPSVLDNLIREESKVASSLTLVSFQLPSRPPLLCLTSRKGILNLSRGAKSDVPWYHIHQVRNPIPSFREVCRRRLRRDECIDCCTYQCELGGGPPESSVTLHPVI